MTKPYVLTDDLSLEFAKYISGNEVAKKAVSEASDLVTASLRKFFPVVERISAEKIQGFLNEKVSQSAIPVISLAGIVPSDGQKVISIEASRTVRLKHQKDGTFQFQDNGILPRNSSLPAVSDQFSNAVLFVTERQAQSVNILDDVIFTGSTVLDYVDKIQRSGLIVETVIANVAIEAAAKKLESRGITVDADYTYTDVIDEVCMRDFIIGAPGGGRNLLQDNGKYTSVPYLYPFANVDVWASINKEHAVEFSKDCLEASLHIWSQIAPEQKFSELDKPVFTCNPEDKIVDTLNRMLKERAYERFEDTLRL
ncbi:MAG: hypothetical protein CMH30_07735 [Micavibrio sp.]|nr:hypothetical protein [Micavibrio sp.]|tara:strand:+ start:2036 stop:2968 length:933 start_codon:yes stop_codon:yes gene_type:complete